MWSIDQPPQWVGRGQELAIVRAGVEALGRGEGAVVWVEGEPGIGKSSLVAEALAAGSAPGWDLGWGVAGKLTERLPLRVMVDCLQVRPGSPSTQINAPSPRLRASTPARTTASSSPRPTHCGGGSMVHIPVTYAPERAGA